jgi:hypothetical protein
MEGCFNYVLFSGSEVSDNDGNPTINKYFVTQSTIADIKLLLYVDDDTSVEK